ncbi:MAG: hypothetical protein KKF98_14455 [Bacteroidetes bacterium]|nr:hypothetical protein [Bacteroidota bacterium]
MKKLLGYLFFIFISAELFGQYGGNRDDYSTLIAKLLSTHHEASSNTIKYSKLSDEEINAIVLREFINIYVKYEFDIEVALDKATPRKRRDKLMNLDFIYSYRYIIPYSSTGELNSLLPTVELRENQSLINIQVFSYNKVKGKTKRVAIKTKYIEIDTSLRKVSLSFPQGTINNSGLLDIVIETRTQHYNSLHPYFNTNAQFSRQLTLSIPTILSYELPTTNENFVLNSVKEDLFYFLNIRRGETDWDNIVSQFGITSLTYTYNVHEAPSHLNNISFKLKKTDLPYDKDIGIPLQITD